MNSDEQIEIFKNECRNYSYYFSRLEDLKKQKELIETKLINVKSVPFDAIAGRGSSQERPVLAMIEKKQEVENRIKYYELKLGWIETIINKIPSPAYRMLVFKTFVERESINDIAEKYDVGSDRLYKTRKKYLTMAIEEKDIQRLISYGVEEI